eukprot:1011971-Prorocentrum_lima.AAC.1
METQVKEQIQRLRQDQAQDIGRGVDMFVTRMIDRKWQEWESKQTPSRPTAQTPSNEDMVR